VLASCKFLELVGRQHFILLIGIAKIFHSKITKCHSLEFYGKRLRTSLRCRHDFCALTDSNMETLRYLGFSDKAHESRTGRTCPSRYAPYKFETCFTPSRGLVYSPWRIYRRGASPCSSLLVTPLYSCVSEFVMGRTMTEACSHGLRGVNSAVIISESVTVARPRRAGPGAL
jgi:hypothetical protein